MTFSIQVFHPAEWLHINALNDMLCNYHGAIVCPFEEYDLTTLVAMERTKAMSPKQLHILWTNRIVATDSSILN